MFGLGPTELIVIGVLGVLLFGNKLPGVMRNVGATFMEFKRGMAGYAAEGEAIKREVNQAVGSLRAEGASVEREVKHAFNEAKRSTASLHQQALQQIGRTDAELRATLQAHVQQETPKDERKPS